MGCGERRRCKCCRKLFRPDPRNRRHQHYCSGTACRAASKAASQARGRSEPEGMKLELVVIVFAFREGRRIKRCGSRHLSRAFAEAYCMTCRANEADG